VIGADERMHLRPIGRERAANDDAERGLQALERAGVENEASLWAAAFVHYRRGRHAEAGAALEKLARSPHLDPRARAETQASAEASGGGSLAGVAEKGKEGVELLRSRGAPRRRAALASCALTLPPRRAT
jgi:hypothetical protein